MARRIGAFLGLIWLLSGCARPADSAVVRVAVLPILDALPLYVAEAEGYFAAAGVTVEFVAAASAAERDQLLQAGQVDAVITDPVALALYNRDATRVVAVRYAMQPTPGHPQFRVLASAQSGITTPEDLRGVPIGVSEGTIIEYVTQYLLLAAGLEAAEIVALPVPRIPDRMALLTSGELAAATLPEPLASLAVQQGAVVIIDDTFYHEASASLYAFRREFSAAHPETARGFLAAIDRASAAINADKGRWRALLSEQQLVPPSLVGDYELPDYPRHSVPPAVQIVGAVDWLFKTSRLETWPTYGDWVDAGFVED